jgi:hypothetical protein
MTDQDLFVDALNLATFAHKGQMRKFNHDSYICHLVEVVNILKYVGIGDQTTLASALLHDVIEDTFLDSEMLSKELELNSEVGDKIAGVSQQSIVNVVLELSDNKRIAKAERHSALLGRLTTMSERSLNIKLADLLSNMMAKPSQWDEQATAKYYRQCNQIISHIEIYNKHVNQQLLQLALYALDCQTRGSAFYEYLSDFAGLGALYWSMSNNSFVIDSTHADRKMRGVIIESKLSDLFRCGLLHSFKISDAAPISLYCAELHSETGEDFAYAKPIEISNCSKVLCNH